MRFFTCVLATLWLACATTSLRADEPPGDRGVMAASDPSLDGLLADEELAPLITQALECHGSGADDDALKHLRRANAAIKRKHGANATQQLPVLDLAAEILFGGGRYAEAMPPLERAVAIREAQRSDLVPERDVSLASSLLLLGRAQAESGNRAGAVASLTRAAGMFSASLGQDHEATLAARQSLAALTSNKEAN